MLQEDSGIVQLNDAFLSFFINFNPLTAQR